MREGRVEARERVGEHLGVDPVDVVGHGEVEHAPQLVVLGHRGLGLGPLALQLVDAALQPTVLVLEVVVAGDALPAVAERRGDGVTDAAQRREHRAQAVLQPLDRTGVAVVEGEDRQRRQDQEDQREARASETPGTGHRAWDGLGLGVRGEEDALQRLELLERLP